MWLTGKLAPDFKTIADFLFDYGPAIQAACRRFVLLCRQRGLVAGGTVAVDGSRFCAVNARDRNCTPVTIRRRMDQVDEHPTLSWHARHRGPAGRQGRHVAHHPLTERLGEARRQMRELEAMEHAVVASPDRQISLTDPMRARWHRPARAPGWPATTFRRRSIPTATSWSHTRSSTLVMTARR